MVRRSLPLLALPAMLLWQPTIVWAQGQPAPVDSARLEQAFRHVAEVAIPRTVLIKAHTADGQMGAGSGAIISHDGYILTCSHVVEIGEHLDVVTADGKTYAGHSIGRNRRQDFALVKIDATDIPCFEMGDSDTVQYGQWVVALGHPGGPYPDVQPAFAAGKVRGLHRKFPIGMMEKYYNDAIMTDVPIFAGDSGGPLVDLEGKLIGINGAIIMINDLAFAVPLNQIKGELDAIKGGQVLEGIAAGPEAMQDMQDLISPQDYQKMMSRAFRNLPKLFGGEDSPFGKLFGKDSPLRGMFGGENGEAPDLSKLFGGGQNGEAPDLSKLFGGGQNGEMPDLSKLFGGENGEAPDFSKLFGPDSPLKDLFGPDSPLKDLFNGQGGGGEQGKQLQDMLQRMFGQGQQPGGPGQPAQPTPGAPQGFLGVQAAQGQTSAPGVLIDQVVTGSPAAQGGVQRGDVIVSVDGKATPNMDALRGALTGKGPGTKVQLTVERASFVDTVLVSQRVQLDVTLGTR
jgi:S1-C subfamily serine protease